MVDVHVLPLDDWFPHDETRGCWCAPRVEEVWWTDAVVVVHHSVDGRELLEDAADPPVTRH